VARPSAALPIEKGRLLGAHGCGGLGHGDLSLHYGQIRRSTALGAVAWLWVRSGEGLRVMSVRRRMAGWWGIAMVLVMVASAYPGGARAMDDVAPNLPPGASVVQTVSLDADGDGTPDTVVLYTRRIESSQRGWLNAMVLRGDSSAPSPLSLFDPPGRDQPNGETVIDLAASGSSDDSRPERGESARTSRSAAPTH